MMSSMLYREKSRRREAEATVRREPARRSSAVESFVKLFGSGTRSPLPRNGGSSSSSVASATRLSMQRSLSSSSLVSFVTLDGNEQRSSLERSPSSSSIARHEASPPRSLEINLWKAGMLASVPLEINPPPGFDGSVASLRGNPWKRRGSVALEPGKSRLGRSPFGRSSSQLEVDKTVSREKSRAEPNNNSSNVTTASPAHTPSPGPSRAEVEEFIDRESRNTDEYTTLSTLIKFQRSNSGNAEPPIARDSIVEKAAAVYLRASFSRNSRIEGCSSGFWNSVCRIITAWIPAFSCLGWTDGIPDPENY